MKELLWSLSALALVLTGCPPTSAPSDVQNTQDAVADVPGDTVEAGSDVAPGIDATCFTDAGAVPVIDGSDALNLFTGVTGVGDRDEIEFQYQTGVILSFNPWRPMLTGTHETLQGYRNAILPRVAASTSDATIATAMTAQTVRVCCMSSGDGGSTCNQLTDMPPNCAACTGNSSTTLNVDVVAHAAGTTLMTLLADDGTIFDTITLSVLDAASLTVNRHEPGTDPSAITSLTLSNSTIARVEALAFESGGQQLEARYGITVTSGDPTIIGVREPALFAGTFTASVESFSVEVGAMSTGSTTLTFTAGQVQFVLPVTVQ